jgi:hypothetical protein
VKITGCSFATSPGSFLYVELGAKKPGAYTDKKEKKIFLIY